MQGGMTILDLLVARLGYLVGEYHLVHIRGRCGLGTTSLPFFSSPEYVVYG